MIAAGTAPERRISLDGLMAKFGRRFWFGHARMRDHMALTALRRNPSEPGVTCVITDDLAELADALEQDQEDSRPGTLPPGAAAGPAGRRPG